MGEELLLIKMIQCLLNRDHAKDICFDSSQNIDWDKLLQIADRHNIGSLLYHILGELPKTLQPDTKTRMRMRNTAMREAALDIKQQAEQEALLKAFEEHGLYCMPVKGCNTKNFYSKSEYRTMGDLDILYKPEQHHEVKTLLQELGYGNFQSGLKHDHYYKPPYITLEMHRALVAANTMAEDYYADVWERARPRDGFQYIYRMTLEEEYVYTMIHLLEHFKEGGVGIRFVMDIAVFLKQEDLNRDAVEATFQKLGISEFARNMERLADKWFGEADDLQDETEEAILEELAAFIIDNGIYGKRSQAQALALAKEGRTGYIRRVVFPNLNSMKTLYPWLENKPWLLPEAWLMRIVRTVLFRGESLKVGVDTIKYGDVQKGKELQEFYKRCGI